MYLFSGTLKRRVYLLKFVSEFRLIILMKVGEHLKTLSLAPLSGLPYKGNGLHDNLPNAIISTAKIPNAITPNAKIPNAIILNSH